MGDDYAPFHFFPAQVLAGISVALPLFLLCAWFRFEFLIPINEAGYSLLGLDLSRGIYWIASGIVLLAYLGVSIGIIMMASSPFAADHEEGEGSGGKFVAGGVYPLLLLLMLMGLLDGYLIRSPPIDHPYWDSIAGWLGADQADSITDLARGQVIQAASGLCLSSLIAWAAGLALWVVQEEVLGLLESQLEKRDALDRAAEEKAAEEKAAEEKAFKENLVDLWVSEDLIAISQPGHDIETIIELHHEEWASDKDMCRVAKAVLDGRLDMGEGKFLFSNRHFENMVKEVASGGMACDEAQRLIETGFGGNEDSEQDEVEAMDAYLKGRRGDEAERLVRLRFKIGGAGPLSPPGTEPDEPGAEGDEAPDEYDETIL